MDTPATFGQWLSQRRKTLGLTRVELAQRVGCSVSALRKIEDGDRRPSVQIADLLAISLDLPPGDRPTFLRVARGELGVGRLPTVAPSSIPGRVPKRSPHPSLPTPLTPLVGREPELGALARLLRDPQCRLVTLIGPGGIGKTRLAIQAASDWSLDYADKAFFVALAPLASPEFLVPAMAEALGLVFFGPSDPKTQLLSHLQATKPGTLMVLDNFEHLLEGAELLAEILQHAPDVKLLVTSRERLNLQGEWAFDLHGLPTPPEAPDGEVEHYTAVKLFVQTARRAQRDFALTEQNRTEVARICRLVDGLPLAIELAAAWTPVLSCREIAQEVEHNLDFLASTQRDIPARHRSLRAVFDHSWKLLSEAEQHVLRQLTVFRGGFSREAAEHVAEATLAILSSLVSKSLIRRDEAGRYDLHDLLRQYAATHLNADCAECQAARERHYAFHLALAEAADVHLRGSDQLAWISRLEQEHDNLRAALAGSLEIDSAEPALRLAGALRWFWYLRGYYAEGRGWLTKALNHRPPSRTALYARALEGAAFIANGLGDHGAAQSWAEESAAIFKELGDRRGLADALLMVGQTLRWQGEGILGESCLKEALALHREVGDPWNVARSVYHFGSYLADFRGDAAGRAMLEECTTILEALGDKFLLVNVLVSRGVIALIAGDYPRARLHLDRSLTLAREIEDPWGQADSLTNLGCVLRIQGNYAAAEPYFEQALSIYREGGSEMWGADPLCALAENEASQGNLPAARLRLRDASAIAATSENRWLQTLVGYFRGLLAYYDGDVEHAARLLDKTVVLARESHYRPELARALVTLGRVSRACGETARAAALFREGLGLYLETDAKLGIATALEGYAGLQLSEDAQRAARLFATAEAVRAAIGAPLPPIDCPAYERDLAALRAQLGEASFSEAWAQGQAEPYETLGAQILEFTAHTAATSSPGSPESSV